MPHSFHRSCTAPNTRKCLLRRLANSVSEGMHDPCLECGLTSTELGTDAKRIGQLLIADVSEGFHDEAACHSAVRRALSQDAREVDGTIVNLPPPRITANAFTTIPRRLGDYEIIREVGRGGMGIVFEARQQSLNRRVALKVLPHAVLPDEEMQRRFQREAEAAARLHHTNIVPVFENGSDCGVAYLAMQLIDGHSLEEMVKNQAPHSSAQGLTIAPSTAKRNALDTVSMAEPSPLGGDVGTESASEGHEAHRSFQTSAERHRFVASVGAQIARALAYAHDRGVLHRDVKPSNVILDLAGNAWLADFGLAKTSDDGMTRTAEAPGTLRYMASERFRGHSDERSDTYALGVTLYELLLGRRFFASKDRLHLMRDVLDTTPAPPRSIDPSVPTDLETILVKATAKDPIRRYQTAKLLMLDLQRFMDDQPISARRPSYFERIARWVRKNKAVAASVAASAMLCLFLVLGLSISVAYFQQQELTQRELAESNRRNLYHAEMKLALDAFESTSGIPRTRELLSKWAPQSGQEDLRGWEWYLLNAASHSEASVVEVRTSSDATSTVLPQRMGNSKNGRRAFLGSEFQLAMIDLVGGQGAVLLAHPFSYAKAIDCAEDGGRCISIMEWGMVEWCVDSGDTHFVRFDSPNCSHGAAHFESSQAAIWQDGELQLRRFDGELVANLGSGHEAAAFSSHGAFLATSRTDHSLVIYDTTEPEQTTELPAVHAAAIASMSWSPDDKRIATGSRNGLAVYEVGGRIPPTNIPAAASVRCLAWSSNGQRLATGSDDLTVRIWDANTWQVIRTLRGHDDWIIDLHWSDDGRHVVSCGQNGQVRSWDLDSLPAVDFIQIEAANPDFGLGCIDWSPDGRCFSCTIDDGTESIVWDVTSRQPIGPTYSGIRLQWSHDGKFISTNHEGGIRVCSTEDPEVIDFWPFDHKRPDLRRLPDRPWHPTKNRILFIEGVNGAADRVMEWTPFSGEPPRALVSNSSFEIAVTPSPDGSKLVVAGAGNEAWIHNAETGQRISPLFDELRLDVGSHGLAWSPSGSMIAAAGKRNGVFVASPDDDTTIQLLGHTAIVRALAFSPDEARLASASGDHTVKLWDPRTGKEVISFRHDAPVGAVAWSPDGRTLTSVSVDGKIHIWSLLENDAPSDKKPGWLPGSGKESKLRETQGQSGSLPLPILTLPTPLQSHADLSFAALSQE